VRRGDVEEGELVGLVAVVTRRDLDRVARVAEADEVHALHDPAILHVEARDASRFGERQATSGLLAARRRGVPSRGRRRRCRSRGRRSRLEVPAAERAQLPDVVERRDPPDAITGTSTASASASTATAFTPSPVPSRAMSVKTIAAAPARCTSTASPRRPSRCPSSSPRPRPCPCGRRCRREICPGCARHAVREERGILERRRPEHDAAGPCAEHALQRREVADAAADLDLAPTARHDARDRVLVHRLRR
jgi:hypothetical protein